LLINSYASSSGFIGNNCKPTQRPTLEYWKHVGGSTVIALSQIATNPQVRETFYAHNPIPGAMWRVQPDNTHVLTNADEIIPADYTSDMLRDNVDEYMRMHTWMQKKLPKYVRTARINYEEKGEHSILVSNNQNRTRINDQQEGQDLRDYYQSLKTEVKTPADSGHQRTYTSSKCYKCRVV
jgi:hypothetical protein